MSTGDHAISFDLTGTVAVVTGAAQGIGQAVAVALAQMGADVACVDRDAERQAETVAGVEAHGRRALAIGGDVTDREGVERPPSAWSRSSGRSAPSCARPA